jgi:hypothetical protein
LAVREKRIAKSRRLKLPREALVFPYQHYIVRSDPSTLR